MMYGSRLSMTELEAVKILKAYERKADEMANVMNNKIKQSEYPVQPVKEETPEAQI